MDISAITNIISNLGFPIACVFASAWFCWYMVKHTNEINAKNYVTGLCWIYANSQWYSCIPYLYSGGKWNICV